MLRRNILLSALSFASVSALPGRALTQTATKPVCYTYKTVGSWTVGAGVTKNSQNQTFRDFLRLNQFQDARGFRIDSTNFGKTRKGQISFRISDSGTQVSFHTPNPVLPDGKRYDLTKTFQSRKAELVIRIGRTRYKPLEMKRPIKVISVNQKFMDTVASGQTISAEVLLDGVTATKIDFPNQRFTEAIRTGRGLMRQKSREVAAAGDCNVPVGSPCIMTTAAVDILGRDDDCFELRQMRNLRAHYADQTDLVEDYVAEGARILAEPSIKLNAFLLAFYALVVWPTVFLAALRAFPIARAWYLAGFAVLKRVV